MALPSSINPATPAGTDQITGGDDQIRALKLFIADILGLPVDPTQMTAAIASTTAAGLITLLGNFRVNAGVGVNMAPPAAGDLSISGTMQAGTVPDARLSTNVVLKNVAAVLTALLTLNDLELDDQDGTPVANRRLRVINGLIRAATVANVEGRHISRLSIEQITAAEIAPATITNAEVAAGAAIAASKLSGVATLAAAQTFTAAQRINGHVTIGATATPPSSSEDLALGGRMVEGIVPFTRLAHTSLNDSNTALVTVTTGATRVAIVTFASLLAIGHRVFTTIQVRISKGVTGGSTTFKLAKLSGTANVTFPSNRNAFEFSIPDHPASTVVDVNFGGIIDVTGGSGGSLVLELTVISLGSNATVTIGEGGLSCVGVY